MDKEVKAQWVQFLTPHWWLPNGVCFVVSVSAKQDLIAIQLEWFIQFKKIRRDYQKVFIFN